MAYRDDREALVRRAEALERDLARLQRDHEVLAAEREALARERIVLESERDAERRAREAADRDRAAADRERDRRRTDLERRAARTKPPAAPSTLSSRAAKEARAPTAPRSRRSKQARRADSALASTPVRVVWIVAPGAVIAGTLWGFLRFAPLLSIFALHLSAIVSLFAALGIGYLVRFAAARLERRRLAALDPPLDHAGYLDLLGAEHDRTRVTARLTFGSPPDRADRGLIARVARGGVEDTTARWDGDELVITGPVLRTATHARREIHHDNGPIHRWFRRLERRVLRPIGRAFPPKAVRMSTSPP
jgi:hypothetical protein